MTSGNVTQKEEKGNLAAQEIQPLEDKLGTERQGQGGDKRTEPACSHSSSGHDNPPQCFSNLLHVQDTFLPSCGSED